MGGRGQGERESNLAPFCGQPLEPVACRQSWFLAHSDIFQKRLKLIERYRPRLRSSSASSRSARYLAFAACVTTLTELP